jgi:hypothetical protein
VKVGAEIEKGVVGSVGIVILTVAGRVGMLRLGRPGKPVGRLRDCKLGLGMLNGGSVGKLRLGMLRDGRVRLGKGSVKLGSCRSSKPSASESVGMLRVGMGRVGIVNRSGMPVNGSGMSVKGSGISVKGSANCRSARPVGSGGRVKPVGTLNGTVGRVSGMVGSVNGIVGRASDGLGMLIGMVVSVRLGSWRWSTGAAPTRLRRC